MIPRDFASDVWRQVTELLEEYLPRLFIWTDKDTDAARREHARWKEGQR